MMLYRLDGFADQNNIFINKRLVGFGDIVLVLLIFHEKTRFDLSRTGLEIRLNCNVIASVQPPALCSCIDDHRYQNSTGEFRTRDVIEVVRGE